MKGKIVNTKEAVKEMMNGEVLRALDDKDTFFTYHETKDMIYMIHYDQITNRMGISPIAAPLDILNDKNTFLQGYAYDKFIITTFFEMFNEFDIPNFFFGKTNLDKTYLNTKKFKDVKCVDDSSMYKSNLSDHTYPIKKEDK